MQFLKSRVNYNEQYVTIRKYVDNILIYQASKYNYSHISYFKGT